MKLVQNKETGEFLVLPDDASLEGFTFLGKYENAELRKIRKAITTYIDSLPVAELPDLKGFKDRDLVEAYIAIRDTKEKASKAADSKKAKYDGALDKLDAEMVSRCNERGVKSIAVEGVATATRKETVQATVSDWEKTYDFIYATAKKLESEGKSALDAFAFLYKRISSTAVTAYQKDHDGEVPPGVNVITKYEMGVRRSNSKQED